MVAEFALGKKAEDVLLVDLRQLNPVADFFVICSGASDVHVKAICDGVRDGMTDDPRHVKPWHVEGYPDADWILLDYIDVVVHVFCQKTRDYYALERLWGDAPTQTISAEE